MVPLILLYRLGETFRNISPFKHSKALAHITHMKVVEMVIPYCNLKLNGYRRSWYWVVEVRLLKFWSRTFIQLRLVEV